jgi:hypothetical protein
MSFNTKGQITCKTEYGKHATYKIKKQIKKSLQKGKKKVGP